MASSYSTDLKIELMVTGENAGTWGDKTNDNLNVIQQAIAGYGEQSIAGGAQTTTLTIANSPTLSVARNIVLKLTGTITGNQIVTIPSGIEKTWIVSNGTTGAFTVQFKTTDVGSTGTTWSTTDKGIKIVYSNGTEIFPADLSTLSGTVASAQIANLAVTSAKLASFAVTEARLASFAVTTSRLATNAVTAVKITQSTITQAKLAANSVGSNQLISTGVTAATYTAATITVDADGRITAASSGSGGAGMAIPVVVATGPSSGTYTKNAAANRIAVYMVAGGGGHGFNGPGSSGNPGGNGGGGFYNFPTTTPFSQPYAVGAGGNNAGPSGTGGAGGNTTLATVGTVNGGGGGIGPSAAGAPGNQPGASLAFPITSYFRGGSGFFQGGADNLITALGFGRGSQTTGPICAGKNTGPGNPGYLVIYENTGT
jgi:hypothetical protein